MKSSPFIIQREPLLDEQYALNEIRQYVEEHPMKYQIHTYGCQMNEHDSEKIAGILELMGIKEAASEEEADFILFNTCAVRENAEMKVYGNIGQVKHLKEGNRDLILGICGCMMQQEHVVNTIKSSYPFVDLVFGTHNFHQLPLYLHEKIFKNKKVFNVLEDSKLILENLPSKRKASIKSYVNIMQGCNNFCTFCIVPHTRGRERSRHYTDIVAEITQLVQEGTKEVTLLGQNVNSYSGGINFPQLLEKINEIEGLKRIRFMTSHPKDFSDELIESIASLDKVCEYVHLPVQSGSTEILRRMNRKYTKEEYLEKMNRLKTRIPGVSISTDIMIGFPGESVEDVLETIDVIKKVEYDSAFTFIYSPRKNTPAINIPDDVSDEEKHRRFEMMLEELNTIVIRKNSQRVGLRYEVLIEEVKPNHMLVGRTRENYLVTLEGEPNLLGEIVSVTITEAKKFSLVGVIDGH